MMELDQKIRFVRGVGPKMAARLDKLGIRDINDLIFYFPRAWIDFSKLSKISQLRLGDEVIIEAKVLEISNIRTLRKKMFITRARLQDESGEIYATWFSQPYLTKNILIGAKWFFMGKVAFDWQKREKILTSPIYEKNSQILPIYPETKGINSKYLRRIILHVLDEINLIDFLPAEIISKEKLLNLSEAINNIHFPKSSNLLAKAKERLAFDELFLIVLKMQISKLNLEKSAAPKIAINKDLLKRFSQSLSFTLTNAQRKAAWEIINDLAKNTPMNRLLEGDVGSGKTIVALMAAINTIKSGYQVVWMAPTTILANQHFDTANKLLKPFGIKITLLTAKTRSQSLVLTRPPSQAEHHSGVAGAAKNSELIIGTHALIQKNVQFPKLGLVIIDEQHRFGVQQRGLLVARGSTLTRTPLIYSGQERINTEDFPHESALNPRQSAKSVPHFLSMTATPIPRTLALSLYGDLDISILNEMPKNRKKIITRLVDPINRQKAYEFIRAQINAGRQVYVICPLIEYDINKSKHLNNKLFEIERKSVKKEFEKLTKEIFPKFKIAKLFGKMKETEKQKTMTEFKAKKIDILVSTSVIEVGIDVANATVMMIEGADHFGLAQLHQFRGRVGRGEHQSFCLLFTDSLSQETNRRLKALVECHDGFKLAQKDLEIRGPGELAGIAQSGLPDLKIAKLSDIIQVEKARSWADTIVANGLSTYPKLIEKIKEFEKTRHLE